MTPAPKTGTSTTGTSKSRTPKRRTALRTAAMAIAAALVVVGLTPVVAQGAGAAPTSVVVVPGDKRITVGWRGVSGATKYTLQVSSTSAFSRGKTRTLTTASTALAATDLRLGKTYWVRVKAGGSWSSKYSAVPNQNSPRYKTSVTVRGAGTNKVRVSWPRYVAGTSLKVVASWSNENVYTQGVRTVSGADPIRTWTTNVSIARTSVVLTVPSKWRAINGSKGTEPVFVHLYARNGSRAAHSITAIGYPSPPALRGSTTNNVTFATWNVGSKTATADLDGRTWNDRKRAVRNGILHANTSVVAVQEASASQASKQYQELVRLVYPTYRSAIPLDRLPVTTKQINTTKSWGTAGISRSDHILYKPTDVRVLSAGLESTFRHSGGVTWDRSKFDRHFAWALMQSKSSGEKFFVVSTHLESGRSATLQRMRKAAAKGIRTFLDEKAARARVTVAMIVMGDFNSDTRWPHGPQVDMISAGYASATQAHSTVQRKNTTSNNHYASIDGGYPIRPYRYAYTGTRIDYIFVKRSGGVTRFVNQMILRDGKFDERYRGSDHNLQWARIRVL
jgi:endonuclease/exonuclease/phosphatase family metal-dependent hydrolase